MRNPPPFPYYWPCTRCLPPKTGRQHRIDTGKGYRFFGTLVLVLVLASCDLLLSGPPARAMEYVQQLVATPAPTDTGQGPALQLKEQVAFNYLRALHEQEVTLSYSVNNVIRLNDARTQVVVSVGEERRGGRSPKRVHFVVDVERDQEGRWRVNKIRIDSAPDG